MKLLMSIKPVHVNNILSGTKKYEFRKSKCKQKIDSIIIYSTTPVQKIVAEVEVIEIIVAPPPVVWEKTACSAGIDKASFDQYFSGCSFAVAYALGNIVYYNPPRELSDYGIKRAPQSYLYICDAQ